MSEKQTNHKSLHEVVHSKKESTKSHAAKSDDKPVDSKKSLITVFVIIGILILILAAMILSSKYLFKNKNIVEYNHYVFEKFEDNKWMTQQYIGGQLYNIPFYYNPTQVLDIPVENRSILALRAFKATSPNGQVYISVDPNESSRVVLAGVEYARLLGNVYGIYNMNVKSAITKPYGNLSSENSPAIITCDNQSKNTFIIIQQVTDKNLISVNGNCVTIESSNINESVRVADAFAFRLLNIIRD